MLINNHITDLLDLAVSKDWKEFTLQPARTTMVVESNYEESPLMGQPDFSREELEADLEALGLDWIITSESGTGWYTHKSEEFLKKFAFLITQKRQNKRGAFEPHLQIRFQLISVPMDWNPTDDKEEEETQ